MKCLIFALTSILSLNVLAIEVYSTPTLAYSKDYNCSDIQRTVLKYKRLVIYQNENVYDLYVANGSYCQAGDVNKPGFVKSRDSDRCQAGFVCKGPK